MKIKCPINLYKLGNQTECRAKTLRCAVKPHTLFGKNGFVKSFHLRNTNISWDFLHKELRYFMIAI